MKVASLRIFVRALRRLQSAVHLCLLTVASVPGLAATPASQLQASMTQILREEGLVGAVWGTTTADGRISVGAAGLKDARTAELLNVDTRVHVGSVTKAVLATGVLRLVSEGRLSLDTPVSDLLPEIQIESPWQDSDPVRVRHLLAHTGGLENLRFWQVFSLEVEADTPLRAAFAREPLKVQTRPGERFGYSNIGYALLGMVIEAVTGARYEYHFDRHLLPALSMDDSTFGFTHQTGRNADPRLAMGHFERATPQPAVPLYLRPAAQFTTTAADMVTFARFLMGDGKVDGRSFIDPVLLGDPTRAKDTEAARAGLRLGHGHVLVGRDRHGAVGACHPGNTVGFWSMLCVYPEHGSAFFIAVNTDSESADYERLTALLVHELALPLAMATPVDTPAGNVGVWSGVYVRTPVSMPSLGPLAALTGFVKVKWDGAELRILSFPGHERRLMPVGGLLFRAEGRTVPSHALLTAADGTHIVTDGLRSYRQVPAWIVVLPWLSLLAGVIGLAWIVVVGPVRLLRGRLRRSDPLFAPLFGFTALLLPLPFLLQQSILQLGDRTAANLLLALATTALPAGLLIGMFQALRRHRQGSSAFDTLAVLLALQCAAVLIASGVLPVRLWTW